jgi:peptidoglycan hydrolase-like protein with peptidoglycan-binding domain
MPLKHVTATLLAASMLAIPAEHVKADEFVGGLVGGLIGGAIGSGLANQAQQNRQRTTTRTVYVNPQATAQRSENRQVQTSLNYFGFPAGVADGVLGSRSRSAISTYQVYMGFPATGRLTEYEKNLLLGAYGRAVAGGQDVASIIAKSPDGVRGVLKAQRDGSVTRTAGYAGLPLEVSQAVDEVANSSDPSAEQLLQRSGFIQLAELNGDGSTDYIIDTGLAGSSFWCNATACKTMVFASTPNGYTRNDLLMHSPTPASFSCIGGTCQVKSTSQPQTQLASAQPTPETVPSFQTQDQTTAGVGLPVFTTTPKQKSLSSFCSKVNLLTSSNGGFTTVSTMSDPSFTLSEQFCLGRTYTVAAGEELMATVQGATPKQIAAQCDSFGGNLATHIASLNTKPASAVLNDVAQVVLSSGMTPDQLRTTSRICMASGYQTDNMQTALAGALLMTALGDRPVAELVGHHVHGGFGTPENDERSIDWYEMALNALDGGSAPVFAPDQTDRVEVLRQATLKLSGADTATAVPTSADSGKMPVFNLSE